PASPRSPASRASTGTCTSAGPATSGSAPRSRPSPITAGTPAPGPPRSTPTPAPAARTTPTPSASWPAPGSASYGPAGSTESPTTQPSTALPPHSPNNRSSKSRPEVDTGGVMGLGVAAGEEPAADGEQDDDVGADDGQAGPRGEGEALDRFGRAERVGVDELGEVLPGRGGREPGQRRHEH